MFIQVSILMSTKYKQSKHVIIGDANKQPQNTHTEKIL